MHNPESLEAISEILSKKTSPVSKKKLSRGHTRNTSIGKKIADHNGSNKHFPEEAKKRPFHGDIKELQIQKKMIREKVISEMNSKMMIKALAGNFDKNVELFLKQDYDLKWETNDKSDTYFINCKKNVFAEEENFYSLPRIKNILPYPSTGCGSPGPSSKSYLFNTEKIVSGLGEKLGLPGNLYNSEILSSKQLESQ